jgi:hypothetical protein
MKSSAILACILMGVLGVRLYGEEKPPEAELPRAKLLAGEGDLSHALPVLFHVMRAGSNDAVRQDARGTLEALGLTRQEIFHIDPATLNDEGWNKLVTRLRAVAVERRRAELDVDYAQGLLALSFAIVPAPNGDADVIVQPKELAQALHFLLQAALSDNGGDKGREAQVRLEALGISGPMVDTVARGAREGKVPQAEENEIVCQLCLETLSRYKDWAEKADENEETALQKKIALERGRPLAKCLRKRFAETSALKRNTELLANFDENRGGPEQKF